MKMDMLHLCLILMIVHIGCSTADARLKCRRDTVGTAKGVGLEMSLAEKECDSNYFRQASYKYCYATHCIKGTDEWLTHYGCTKSAEKGACSDTVEQELKDLYGLTVSCTFCTIGRKMVDMSNSNFPLYNNKNDGLLRSASSAKVDETTLLPELALSNKTEMYTTMPITNNNYTKSIITKLALDNMTIGTKSTKLSYHNDTTTTINAPFFDNIIFDSNSCTVPGIGMPIIIVSMAVANILYM